MVICSITAHCGAAGVRVGPGWASSRAATDARPVVVYIEADDDTGFDAAADIIARALANVHPAVAGPAAAGQGEPAPVVRDLLDDIAAVLDVDRRGAEKVPAADIPARLRSLAPDWAPYRSINGLEIRRYLDAEHGVKVATTGRRYPVDPGVIRDAITPPRRHPRPGRAG